MTSPNIMLSRYFDENVKLVANVCSRCYEEFVDVKVISVNLKFLKQINKHLNELSILLSHIQQVNNLGVKNLDENGESYYGFSEEEIKLSLNESKKIYHVINTGEKNIDKLQSLLIKNNNFSKTSCFKGFHLNEAVESSNEHKKVIKGTERIRYKIYERVNSRVLKNVCKTPLNKPGLKKNQKKIKKKENGLKGVSKYFKDEAKLEGAQSKYFSLQISNEGKNTKISIKQEVIEPNLKPKSCGSSEICTETCTNHIKTENTPIDYESEYFKTLGYSQLPFDSKIKVEVKSPFIPKMEDFENGNIYKTTPIWIPPKSPHNLIEEVLYHDPWALLIATIFLNRTTCMCARPYVFWFLKENPDPLRVLEKKPGDLEKYFVNLGLQKTRSVQVWRMSYDFVHKKWKNVRELYGIGKYGENAFKMFCLGDFNVEPKDRFLRIYKAWYEKVESKKGENFEEKCL